MYFPPLGLASSEDEVKMIKKTKFMRKLEQQKTKDIKLLM